MTLVDRMTVAAAEQVGETMGPRAGLTALLPLVTKLESKAEACRALFAALSHAIALSDRDAAQRLIDLFPIASSGARFPDVVAACHALRGWPELAVELATEETTRTRSARAFYLRGRLLCDLGARERAADDFLSAHAHATTKHLPLVANVAAAQAFCLGRHTMRREVDPVALPPPLALRFAETALSGKGRYARVAGLDLLLRLATGDDGATAQHARRIAARYADATLSALTEIERDRLRSIFGTEPEMTRRAALLKRWEMIEDVIQTGSAANSLRASPHRRRIDAVLSARTAGPRPPGPAATWLSLELCARLAPPRSSGDLSGANALIHELRELLPSLTAVSRALYTAATLALEEPATREAGAALARVVLERDDHRPENGWRRLATALRTAGEPALANQALLIGAQKREAGARDDYRVALAIEARAAYDRGDPEAALRALSLRDAI